MPPLRRMADRTEPRHRSLVRLVLESRMRLLLLLLGLHGHLVPVHPSAALGRSNLKRDYRISSSNGGSSDRGSSDGESITRSNVSPWLSNLTTCLCMSSRCPLAQGNVFKPGEYDLRASPLNVRVINTKSVNVAGGILLIHCAQGVRLFCIAGLATLGHTQTHQVEHRIKNKARAYIRLLAPATIIHTYVDAHPRLPTNLLRRAYSFRQSFRVL